MKRPVVIGLLAAALLLVCAGIGTVIFFSVRNGFAVNDPFDVRNISSKLEESKTIKVDAEKPITLKVIDDAGDVTVTGADVETMQVKVVKTAYDSSQARADEEVKTIKYTVEQTGNMVTLKYEIPESMNFRNKVNTVDFIITLPKNVSANVNTNGDISVQDVVGDADLNTDFGDLNVENLNGGLTVDTNNGDVQIKSVDTGGKDLNIGSDFGDITLEQIMSRDVKVDSTNGAITFTNVRASGEVYTQSDFGDIKYDGGSAESLTIDSSNGKIKVIKFDIKKVLKIDSSFGDIDLSGTTAGSYDLHTSNGDLTIDGIKGGFKAKTEFGNINITNATSVVLDLDTNNGDVTFDGTLGDGAQVINSEFGDVTLTIPGDSNLNVDFTTSFGNINSEIPITVTLTGNSKNDQQSGVMNAGGSLLTIKTNNGNINIKAAK